MLFQIQRGNMIIIKTVCTCCKFWWWDIALYSYISGGKELWVNSTINNSRCNSRHGIASRAGCQGSCHGKGPSGRVTVLALLIKPFYFRVLQTLAKLGLLPKRLSTVMPPKCAACIYGAAHKQPWQTWEGASTVCIFLITSSATCISIYQMISQEPGFVAFEYIELLLCLWIIFHTLGT